LHQLLKDSHNDEKRDHVLQHQATRCVIFFGTPHHGTSLQSLQEKVQQHSGASKAQLLADLEPGSEILTEVLSSLQRSKRITYVTCVEQRATPGQVNVSINEARLYTEMENVVRIQRRHREMNVFDHENDASYHAIADLLRRVLKSLV
jgi:hypothetical protein